jgi:hypothetical protein
MVLGRDNSAEQAVRHEIPARDGGLSSTQRAKVVGLTAFAL